MAQQTQTQILIGKVQARLRLADWGRRTYRTLLGLGFLYVLALGLGRLTGYFPTLFEPWQIAVLPILAGVIGGLLPGRPTPQQAARLVDQKRNSRDLFLTATLIDNAAGDYKPLVLQEAEQLAQKVQPSQVLTFQWERPAAVAAGLLVALLTATYFVPVLDPFGKVAEAQQEGEQRKELERSRKAIEARKAQLADKDLDSKNSEEVETALEKLAVGFQKMKKGEREENQKRLNLHQSELSKLYQKLNTGDLKSLMSEQKVEQQLGAVNDEELFRKMQRELQQGSTETLTQELDSLKNDLERLMKTEDPAEKADLQRQVQKKMKELSDFASDKAGSKQLHAALEKALEQMQSGKSDSLSKEALEAVQESLELSQEEAQALAQAARDLKSLEEAMKMISMSKKMNASDQLDGEMMGGEMSLEEYEELYAQLMGMGMGEGDGEGLGGGGIGEGGEAPEDDSVTTDFVDEKSQSAIQKGKILLSMKTKGLSDSGDIKDEEYTRIVTDIKQSLDDVIEQEQIPPGYVDSIKKYFDTISSPAPTQSPK